MGQGGGGLVHPESENSMAMYGLAASVGINVLGQLTAILCAAWSRKAIPHRSCLVFIDGRTVVQRRLYVSGAETKINHVISRICHSSNHDFCRLS